jgi:formylglycine-generating enzyme required for sulfatase activity
MTNCGASSESCCTSLEVTGGTYYRTFDPIDLEADGGPSAEADLATVSSFRLDKYLVTVGRFTQFVIAWENGSGYTPPAGSGKHTHLNGGNGLNANGGGYEPGWVAKDDSNIAVTSANLSCDPNYATWTTSGAGQENLPIDCVNWYEAYAFCIWDGGFLPSESEWEYAAAGGSQQRAYPWGNTGPGMACPGTGCQYAIYGCYYPAGLGACTGVMNIASVGMAARGAGLWGHLDLAGEVFEWNLDGYGGYGDPCTDCADVTDGVYKIVRGGSYHDLSSYLMSWNRGRDGPAPRYGDIGVRCARSPQ